MTHMPCQHPYSWKGARALLFKLVNVISGTASCWSSFYSVGDRAAFWAEIARFSLWSANCSIHSVNAGCRPVWEAQSFKPITLSTLATGTRLSIMSKNLCYHEILSCLTNAIMTQTCRSLEEKYTKWQNHPLWTKMSAPWVDPGDGSAGKPCWSNLMHVSFSCRNAECL